MTHQNQTYVCQPLIVAGFNPRYIEQCEDGKEYRRGDVIPDKGLAIGDTCLGKTAYLTGVCCESVNAAALTDPSPDSWAILEAMGFVVLNRENVSAEVPTDLPVGVIESTDADGDGIVTVTTSGANNDGTPFDEQAKGRLIISTITDGNVILDTGLVANGTAGDIEYPAGTPIGSYAVSYTHLTLPTKA